MSVTESDLRNRYEAMTMEQLLELVDQRATGGLTAIAESVLEEVLNSRGVPTEIRAQIDESAQAKVVKDRQFDESLASPGDRLLARAVDLLLLTFVAIFLRAFTAGPSEVLFFVIFYAYVLLADGLPGGWSIGKRLIGIVVVDATTRNQCSLRQSLVRNLSLILLMLDWVFLTGSKRRQRLGDMVARTIVVKFSSPREG